MFEPLINHGVKIGSFYSDMKNKLNPLARLKEDNNQELKNVIMVVSTLHILLHNLRLIF